jgi:hypothetical protein
LGGKRRGAGFVKRGFDFEFADQEDIALADRAWRPQPCRFAKQKRAVGAVIDELVLIAFEPDLEMP